MVLDEYTSITVFLQSENEARWFRDKVKIDCFKPGFIKTSIAEIDILDSEEDGNADPRSVAGYVKRREEGAPRAIEPPPQSNAKSEKQFDKKPEKEADGLEAGSSNGGADGEGGSGDRGSDGKMKGRYIEDSNDEVDGVDEDQLSWPDEFSLGLRKTLRLVAVNTWNIFRMKSKLGSLVTVEVELEVLGVKLMQVDLVMCPKVLSSQDLG
jgi:hypothetical protein